MWEISTNNVHSDPSLTANQSSGSSKKHFFVVETPNFSINDKPVLDTLGMCHTNFANKNKSK